MAIKKIYIFIAFVDILFVPHLYAEIGQVWDLRADYNWPNNPNGPWSYHDGRDGIMNGALLVPTNMPSNVRSAATISQTRSILTEMNIA